MARVRLGRYEIEDYELPPVCAKCGAKAVVRPRKTFLWHPSWVLVFFCFGVLIYVLLALILTKQMTVPLPLCARHRNYWRNRALFLYGGLAALVLLAVGGGFLGNLVPDRGLGPGPYVSIFMSVGLLFVLWVFVAAIMQGTSIRPAEITDRSITLLALSKDFVEAVREDRRGSEEEDEEDRPRRRRSRDDEENGGYFDPETRTRTRRNEEDER
jgi:hypothetical protein